MTTLRDLIHMPSDADIDAYLAHPLAQYECDLCAEYSALLEVTPDGRLCPRCAAWEPQEDD